MNSQDFLLILIFLIVVVLISIWTGRKQKKPVQLDLRAPDTEPIVLPPAALNKTNQAIPDLNEKTKIPPMRDLNIFFNYNGHSWDAYEVLGIPAGSPMTEVTKAYQYEVKKSGESSHDFLYTAYKAILDRRTI